MESYHGRIRDGHITVEGMPKILDGKVIVTVVDIVPPEEVAKRQQKAFRKFVEGLKQCDEPLSPEFDEVISQRVNITRELDL